MFCQTGSWLLFNTDNSELSDNNVLSLAIDSYNNKWIGTKFGGLVKFDGEEWGIFMPDSAILFPPLVNQQSAILTAFNIYIEKAILAQSTITSGP